MNPMDLYNLLDKKPFQPMLVVLKDGRKFVIDTREFAVVAERFLDIGYQLPGANEGIWGKHVRVLLDEIAHVGPFADAKAGLPS
jgi:hypothetical protein